MYEKIVELIENNRFEPPESYKEDAKREEDEEEHHDYWSLDQEGLESVELGEPDGSSGRGRSGSETSANSADMFKHRWMDRNLMWRDAY